MEVGLGDGFELRLVQLFGQHRDVLIEPLHHSVAPLLLYLPDAAHLLLHLLYQTDLVPQPLLALGPRLDLNQSVRLLDHLRERFLEEEAHLREGSRRVLPESELLEGAVELAALHPYLLQEHVQMLLLGLLPGNKLFDLEQFGDVLRQLLGHLVAVHSNDRFVMK